MGALKPSISTVNAVLIHNRSPRKLKIWKRMSTCLFADSFNDKKMVTASDMELTTRQNNDNCLPLLTRKMANPNSNNNNNSGGVFDNIEDARNRRHSANVSFNHSPPSSTSDSAHIKQENISANGELSNNQMARGFIDSDLLDVHGKRFGCEHCGNSFTDPSNLQRHIRQHHAGARAHPCPECGKTFATSSGLKQHQHIHSSVKPFICEVCHKSYTQFSNLCRHKRMHADCRIRIKCANCGDFFPTSSALGKHRRFCDASSVFSNGPTINERGSVPVNSERRSDPKICQSPPQLLRNCFSHLPRSSMLDWSFGSNPASDRTLREIDPSSGYMPYFFPNRLVTSGLHHNQRESNAARTKSFDRCEISPASSTSSHSRSVRILKEASVQCNDPLVDCIQTTLKKNRSEVPNILQADSSRFRRADRSVHYSPTSRHAETQVQLSPMHSPTLSPVYADGSSSSGLRQRPNLMGDARYCAPNPFTAPASLRPPKISDAETNAFARAGLKDNFKQMLDEMIARQRFFNLASAFATVPNLYGVGPFSTNGKIPGYPSHPYLPRYSNDSEQPLDLSLNGLRDAFTTSGLARKAETLSSKSPVTPRMQGLVSPAKNSEVGSPEAPQIKSSPPWYQPYGVLRNDPNLMKLYGGMNGSLPFGKINGTPMPYPMAFRTTTGNAQHPPMLSPSQMFSMVNSQRRMYDMIQRDCAGLSARSAPQQNGQERSPASNYNGISRCYGSPGHIGGRGNGRFEREKYVCKYCGKLFPRSANLTRHLRTHTGEQPYSCKYCDRNFSISSNLQRHVRNIHKKERPYCCPLCKRAFGQQTNLERHLRKHLEKPESLRRTDLTQDFRGYGESKNTIHGVDEVKDRSSLSPKHSNDERDLNMSPDWNEEHSSKNGFQTSSDDDSEDAVMRKSVSFSSTHQESLKRHIEHENDSLNIVSSDE